MLVIYTEIIFREFKYGENWTKIADTLFEEYIQGVPKNFCGSFWSQNQHVTSALSLSLFFIIFYFIYFFIFLFMPCLLLEQHGTVLAHV